MPRATEKDLSFVFKASKTTIDNLAAGESLTQRTGYKIAELRIKATVDRLKLARTFLQCAQTARRARPPMNRVAVSRAYYSMYHSFRAAVFFVHGGDDHEAHSELPSHLPTDFPEMDQWKNTLKTARLNRNRADYEPYPKDDDKFRDTADHTIAKADELMRAVRPYLRRKGCNL